MNDLHKFLKLRRLLAARVRGVHYNRLRRASLLRSALARCARPTQVGGALPKPEPGRVKSAPLVGKALHGVSP
jgi:hypothetical protein